MLVGTLGCGPAAPSPAHPTGEIAARDDARPSDRCPDEPEDEDGFEDEDGCLDEDDDGDGIADAADLCAREVEDRDGLGDEDGCPEDDFDRDRIADGDDACPREPETYDGHDDGDGCADYGLVFVDGDEILVIERLRFVPGTRQILPDDERLVRALAEVLRREPRFRRIALDAVPTEGEDPRRALARARALRTRLTRAGVEPERLVPRTAPPRSEGAERTEPASELVEVTVIDPLDPRERLRLGEAEIGELAPDATATSTLATAARTVEDDPSAAQLARIAALPRPNSVRAARLSSPSLRAAHAELEGVAGSVRRDAARDREMRRRRHSYDQRAFRLGAADLDAELEANVRAFLRPDPMDLVFYVRVEPLGSPGDASLIASFSTSDAAVDPDRPLVERLAAVILSLLRDHPDLRAFVLQAGWADAVGSAYHGVLLLDPASREVLWTFATESWSE